MTIAEKDRREHNQELREFRAQRLAILAQEERHFQKLRAQAEARRRREIPSLATCLMAFVQL